MDLQKRKKKIWDKATATQMRGKLLLKNTIRSESNFKEQRLGSELRQF
jgi:hypothetical protein